MTCPLYPNDRKRTREDRPLPGLNSGNIQKIWNCKSASVVLISIGALGTVTKNTWDLEFTPESLLVRNSKDLKRDPTSLMT